MVVMKKTIFIFTCIIFTQTQGIFEYDRAISISQKGDWQKSKELLKNILIENPESPDILYDLGVSSFKSNEMEKALSYFSKAAASSFASESLQEKAYYNAGNAHVQLKQLQEAIDAYDRALALNPSNKHAAHNKEIVKKMLEEQKQKEKKDEQDKNEEKNNQEKQDQENKEDNNNKDSQKNSEDNQKKDQDKKQNNEKNEQDENEQNKSQEEKEKEKKEQETHKKEDEQKKQQEKKESEERKKQNAGNNNQGDKKDGEEKNKQPKLSPALNRILHEQEKKDAALNKQMIKAMAGTYTGATDGNNCW